MGIQVEKEETAPLAVIYGDGDLEAALNRILQKQHLRILRIREQTEALPILEKPAYIFFFADGRTPPVNLKLQFREAVLAAASNKSRLVLVFSGVSETLEKILLSEAERLKYPVTVAQLVGDTDGPAGIMTQEAAVKIIRLGFAAANSQRQIILGKAKTSSPPVEPARKHLSAQDVFDQLNKFTKKKKRFPVKKFLGLGIALMLFLTIISPLLIICATSLRAFWRLDKAKDYLLSGQFSASESLAQMAKSDLGLSQKAVYFFGPIMPGLGPVMSQYNDWLVTADAGANVLTRGARLAGKANLLTEGFLSGRDMEPLYAETAQELDPLNESLGIVEARLGTITSGPGSKLLAGLGLPVGKIKTLSSEIPRVRSLIAKINPLLSAMDEIIPSVGAKTYLVVFQNSAELRPTGGFIGSYALVRFENGRLADWKIHDIYQADGQLRGQIAPPDEILHFLGQPNWFMRDSNWAADFPTTARRLLWFLEKETGKNADGVIAVNLGAVYKILQATGPLTLPDFNQTVAGSDFFQKAEFASEINFFAGSSQKRDFLGAVANAILDKLSSPEPKDYPSLALAAVSSLNEKDVLLYFNSSTAQKAALFSGWGGSLLPQPCQAETNNCLMLVEANLGANKANYFVARSLRVDSVISKGGDIENTVTVLYRNDSPSDTWPGGGYKNYLRFLVPPGSKLISFDIGDGRKPVVSPILTAAQLEKAAPGEFFVFENKENNFSSFGTLVDIPIETERVVTFRYRLGSKITFSSPKLVYNFYLIKQPGTPADLLDFTLDYPAFLTPVKNWEKNAAPLEFIQKLVYNSDTSSDRNFDVKFETRL